MRRPLIMNVHRVQVADEVVAARRFDYTDVFEVHLPSPDPLAPREWVARGLDDSPAVLEAITALLLRVRDEARPDPTDLVDWHVVESTSEVIHIERSLPLLHITLVGRQLGPSGRRLTTLLTYERPALSRLMWTFVGVGHRLLVRRMLCYGAAAGPAPATPR